MKNKNYLEATDDEKIDAFISAMKITVDSIVKKPGKAVVVGRNKKDQRCIVLIPL